MSVARHCPTCTCYSGIPTVLAVIVGCTAILAGGGAIGGLLFAAIGATVGRFVVWLECPER